MSRAVLAASGSQAEETLKRFVGVTSSYWWEPRGALAYTCAMPSVPLCLMHSAQVLDTFSCTTSRARLR